MTTLTIDLKKNTEAADVVADLAPGAKVTLYTAIKSKDEQTLVLTLEEIEEGTESADDESTDGEEDSDKEAEFSEDEDDDGL